MEATECTRDEEREEEKGGESEETDRSRRMESMEMIESMERFGSNVLQGIWRTYPGGRNCFQGWAEKERSLGLQHD